MFKERLLLGQYYPVDSFIQHLTARVKIVVTLLYMITLFVAHNWLGWGILAAVCVLTVAVSRVPFKALWRGLKIIFIFCLITMVLNMFFYQGETVLFSWLSFTLSLESLSYALAMALRLLLLVAFASLLTLTTPPIELTDGLESLLTPLARIKVPAHEIAMMMSIALRFIPTILEEFDRIILVQKARGADIGQGTIARRLKMFVPVLVPLFVSAFRRAEDLAQAMEAKCYRGGEGRTRWKVRPWRTGDTLVLGAFGLLLAAAIVARIAL